MARERPLAHTAHHMPAAVSLNLLRLRKDIAAVDGWNAKVAILLTRVAGTMWCFWVFNGIALVSLPTAIRTGSLTVIVNWVSSNWIQLILLPALLVGQRLQNVVSDERQNVLSEHMDTVVDRLDTRTEGGLQEVLAETEKIRERLRAQDEMLARLVPGGPRGS